MRRSKDIRARVGQEIGVDQPDDVRDLWYGGVFLNRDGCQVGICRGIDEPTSGNRASFEGPILKGSLEKLSGEAIAELEDQRDTLIRRIAEWFNTKSSTYRLRSIGLASFGPLDLGKGGYQSGIGGAPVYALYGSPADRTMTPGRVLTLQEPWKLYHPVVELNNRLTKTRIRVVGTAVNAAGLDPHPHQGRLGLEQDYSVAL